MEAKRRFRTKAVFLVFVWFLLFTLSLASLSVLLNFFNSNIQGQLLSSVSWSGYVISDNASGGQIEVTAINASWVVPEVNTSSQGYSSTWIGIGGQYDKTLIQVGTEHDFVDGEINYCAWYEVLPSYAVKLTDLSVSAGDSMVASINLTNSGTNQWQIQIIDLTNGQGFIKYVVYNSTRSSGEWIVERPTINSQVGNLAAFGTAVFSGCYATVDGVSGPIGGFSYSRIEMVSGLNVKLTSVSDLTDDESSFSVSYLSGG